MKTKTMACEIRETPERKVDLVPVGHVTAAEAATRCGVWRQALYFQHGVLEPLHLGGRLFYPRDRVEAYAAARVEADRVEARSGKQTNVRKGEVLAILEGGER